MHRKANTSSHTGATAHRETAGAFNRIHWAVFDNHFHDDGDGDDVYLRACTSDGLVTDLLVGAQIKGRNASYFRNNAERDESGNVLGYWFSQSDDKQLSFWLDSTFPWLIILYDVEQRIAYWEHITRDKIKERARSKTGWRILVPVEQKVDQLNAPALHDVVKTAYETQRFEELGVGMPVGSVSPIRRWRYALLAPRLLTPLIGLSFDADAPAENVLALLASNRIDDYSRLMDSHPKLIADLDSVAWEWKFVRAFAHSLIEDDNSQLELVVNSAVRPEDLGASAVALACSYGRSGDPDRAVAVLVSALSYVPIGQDDDFQPTDKAWLLSIAARFQDEIGLLVEAEAGAEIALRLLSVDVTPDITRGAIQGPLARSVFVTRGVARDDADVAARSADTLISGWRAQAFERGLANNLERTFEQWAQVDIKRIGFRSDVMQGMGEALLTADHAGDIGGYVRALKQIGMYGIRTAESEEQLKDGLEWLRSSGDTTALEQALRHLLYMGSAVTLKEVAEGISSTSFTHRTARANLLIWQCAGSLMSREKAHIAAQLCLEIIMDLEHSLWKRVNPTFLKTIYTLQALTDIIGGLDEEGISEVVERLVDVVLRYPHSLELRYVEEAVPLIPWNDLRGDLQDRWVNLCSELGPEGKDLVHGVLGRLARFREDARAALLRRLDDGDLDAFWYLDLSQIDPTTVAEMRQSLIAETSSTIAAAKQEVFSAFAYSSVRKLIWLSMKQPTAEAWDVVFDFLCEPCVMRTDKAEVVELLIEHVDMLSEDVRRRLQENEVAIVNGRSDPFSSADPQYQGPSIELAFLLGLRSENDLLSEALHRIGSNDDTAKRGAIRILGVLPRENDTSSVMLSTLLGDHHMRVRMDAAEVIGRRIVHHNSVILHLACEQIAKDPGVVVPLHFLMALGKEVRDAGAITAELTDSVRLYLDHDSGHVRRLARGILLVAVQLGG